MKSQATRVAAFVAIVALVSAGRDAPGERTAAVRPDAVFDSLCLAVLLRAPERALGFFSQDSLRYYDGLLDRAQSPEGARADPRLSFEERAAVSALRTHAPKPVLDAPSSAEAVRRALRDPRLQADSAAGLSLERVEVNGERALGMVFYEGTPTPFIVHFAKRADAWKIERIRLSPMLVSLLSTLGVSPEVDAPNLERVMVLWRSVYDRQGGPR